jgi:hypothetical protein
VLAVKGFACHHSLPLTFGLAYAVFGLAGQWLKDDRLGIAVVAPPMSISAGLAVG